MSLNFLMCDIYKVVTVVHGNQLNNHCNRSDTWPSKLHTTSAVLANTKLPSPPNTHTHACTHTHSLSHTHTTHTHISIYRHTHTHACMHHTQTKQKSVQEKKSSTRQREVTLPRYWSGQMMVPFTIGSRYSSITLGSGIWQKEVRYTVCSVAV